MTLYDVYCVKADGKTIVFSELSDWTIVRTHVGYTSNYRTIVEVRRVVLTQGVPTVPTDRRGEIVNIH